MILRDLMVTFYRRGILTTQKGKKMLHRGVTFILLLILLMPSLFSQEKLKPQNSTSIQSRYHHQITQGYTMELLMSPLGIIGKDVLFRHFSDSIPIGLEYPEWSEIEHLWEGGIWIGALVDTVEDGSGDSIKRVSTSNHASYEEGVIYEDYLSEMTPTDTSNPWIHRSISDEDSGAISESDYICEYTDTTYLKDFPKHMPLGVKVVQRSYAWARAVREPIIPIDYTIINIGKKLLKDVYIGIYLDPNVGSIYYKYYYRYNYTGYFPDLRTAYVENGKDPNATPMGFTILCTPTQIQANNYRFYWYSNSVPILAHTPFLYDSALYDLMSGDGFFPEHEERAIKPNQKVDDQWDVSLLFSFGPIEKFEVGETLRVAVALVGGLTARYGFQSIYDNAKVAHTLFARNYYAPIVLPAPNLRIEVGFQRAKLTWDYRGDGINPEDVWDDGSHILQSYPSDHWRRANPPEGHTKGGRIFEGYRLYRSEDPGGTAKSFVMLKQWDMVDSIGPKYGYDVGLEYEFVDSNLHTGKTYWYSVTSYGIEDMNVINYLDWDESVKVETLATKSNETSVLAARKRVKLPFSLSNELGKVLVVPNPYRVDDNYTLEFGGYEGRSRSWNENKRMLKFTHLPPKCTIRIFTIGGDIVATLHHENQTIGEYDWNMLSESNRTIASGVYVFTVESEYGTQTGKFVVIR